MDPDEQLNRDWGMTQADMLGLTRLELQPREMIGALRSTLGAVKTDGAGAGQGSGTNQRFPEVCGAADLLTSRAVHHMERPQGLVFRTHYTWMMIPAKIKAIELRLPEGTYWSILDRAKNFASGFRSAHSDLADQKPYIEKKRGNLLVD